MKQKPSLAMFFLVFFTPYHLICSIPLSGTTVATTSTSMTPTTKPRTTTPPPPTLAEIPKIIYRGSTIRIFVDASERNPSRIFYDPLVQLDPESITAHSQKNLNQVSFKIIMWEPELRRQVFYRVKSLNGQNFNVTKIVENDIHVLPFEEIKLYSDKPVEGTYIRQSYNGQNEHLYFIIECNETYGAEVLAEDLRRDPEVVTDKWNMTCSGLKFGNQLGKEIESTYQIFIYIPTPTAPTSTTTAPTPTPPSQPIVEVSKVSYRGSIIRIFAEASVKNHSRFFYEPLVHLDPKSIIAHPHGLLKWDVVRFNIEMWNSELRRQVLARVKSLKSLITNVTVDEQDVYVLPFETIQLTHGVLTTINSSVEVGMMNTSKSYLRQSESLQFYLTFNSTSSAHVIAENFRLNPGYVLELWNVTLEGHGLDLGNQLGKKLVYKYPIATFNLTSCSKQ